MKYKKRVGERNGDEESQKGVGGGDVALSIQVEHGGCGGGGLGTAGGSTSFFEPWREQTPASGSGHGSSGSGTGGGARDPPEKRLTLFALRLAVLEKAASGLGKLAFAWATVVLLGGFASSLRIRDFWCVTVILVGQGARVFSRSHELEWQQHATSTSTAGGVLRSSSRFFRHVVQALVDPARAVAGGRDGAAAAQFQRQVVAFMKQRTWHAPEVSLLPYTGWVFVSRKIGRLLHWLQLLSALACVALSLMRLWKRDFFASADTAAGNNNNNMRPALQLFYTLALMEASLFLLEKAYWEWKLSIRKLLRQVGGDCGLGAYGHVALTRFFYDAYSRCIDGSIFDGIKMDLVTFAEELIVSDFLDEQLIGVRILERFANANSELSARDTLRKVGTSPRSVERLVEMLCWKRHDEEEVRRCAAEVVSRLASKRQNVLRVTAIPGAIESVASLLHATDRDHEHEQQHLQLNLLGLQILKRLARDHDNCGKMGNARGLLARIIDFAEASEALLRNPHASDSQVRAVKRALQVVKMLVSTTGRTGQALRRDVAENVFTVTHLRGILRHGQQHRDLQKLAADVLTGLAMDQKGTEAIVGTGGLVKLLLSIFLGACSDEELPLGRDAGKALAMLALESDRGCAAVLKARPDVVDQLVSALHDGRRLNAARLLRNLCAYSSPGHREQLRAAGIARALPVAVHATMAETDKVLEASVGLTTEICSGFIDAQHFAVQLRAAAVDDERAYVERLANILRHYRNPEITVPRMRRFVVQQLVWLMTTTTTTTSGSAAGNNYVQLIRDVGMERLLQNVADTTSELECYHVFSGSVGIGKHREDLSAIVESAMDLLAGRAGGNNAQDL